MGKPDQVSSFFWFLLGLVVIYLSHRLGLGSLTNPGPGFLPFWCGVILSGLSLLVFFQEKFKGQARKSLREIWQGVRWAKGLGVVLALLIYTLTFTHLGFILSTTLLLVFLFRAIEPEKWIFAVGGAFLTSLITFLIFCRWLDVQLPWGFLEKIIF
jgi:putative tricarboxylic transport membrane protein